MMSNKQRLIDAKDFDLRVSQKKMSDVFPNWRELPEEVQDAVCKHGQYIHMLLETQPTVDAVEVVHGHWIYHRDKNGIKSCKCSECLTSYGCIDTPHCPNCGAIMDQEVEEE